MLSKSAHLYNIMYTFQELRDTGSKHKGLVITGGIGFGKTAIVDVLMEYSCFGSARTQLVQPAAGMLNPLV